MMPQFLEEEVFMAQHGYLHEWDEGWGGRDESARDRDRERSWRESDRDNRGSVRDAFMLDRDRNDDRGYFDRMGDRARDAFRGDDHHRGERWSSRDWRGSGRDEWRSSSQGGADWGGAPRSFSSHPDDHYRSWRDKQMQALDRDYEDYCREREQQFHSDFDAWRSQRRGQEPLRTGMTQTSQSGDPTGELELSSEMATPQQDQPDAMGAATMGTTSSRGRR
jgi:hypothetical protein